MLTEYIKDTENAREVIVQPDEDNDASNGVLLANGYVYNKKKKYHHKLLT